MLVGRVAGWRLIVVWLAGAVVFDLPIGWIGLAPLRVNPTQPTRQASAAPATHARACRQTSTWWFTTGWYWVFGWRLPSLAEALSNWGLSVQEASPNVAQYHPAENHQIERTRPQTNNEFMALAWVMLGDKETPPLPCPANPGRPAPGKAPSS